MKKIATVLMVIMLFITGLAAAEDNVTAILDAQNCEELAGLLGVEYPNDDIMEEFATKYSGRTISIDGFIYDGIFGPWYDIKIHAGDREEATGGGPYFLLKDVEPEDLGFEGTDFPDYITYGSNVRVVGRIKGYNKSEDSIVLEPVSFEARYPALEGLDISGYTPLEKGAKGDDVKALQQRLIDLYYIDGKADGKYGKNTKAAIEKFQNVNELEVTGIADPATQAVLFSDKAKENSLSISCSSVVVGSNAQTVWFVDGQEFTLKGKKTKTINTRWGKYKFDAYGNYEKIE